MARSFDPGPDRDRQIKGRPASDEPYYVCNESTDCKSRYKGNGELMFHFKPNEKKDGRQYYRDTFENNQDTKWYQHSDGSWIQGTVVR